MKINDFFKRKKIALTNKTLVVAASGGPDSMALVDLLRNLQKRKKFNLIVAHFDHQLRSDSYLETDLLSKYCQKHHLKLINGKWEQNLQPKTGIEAAARKFRYAFLIQTVKDVQGDYLLTAHHGDDLLENILLKFIRSGNPEEMNSLQPVSQMQGIPLLRPLLSFSKQDLLAYDRQQQIEFINDETNDQDDVLRNRLRHHLIPLLKKENSHLIENADRFLREMNATAALAQSSLEKAGQPEPFLPAVYRLPKSRLAAFNEAEKCMYWRKFIWQKWHQRVNNNLGDFHLEIYQDYYYLWHVLPAINSDLLKIKTEQVFSFAGKDFFISSEKKTNPLLGSFWSADDIFYAGSLPSGSKLLLKNGQHAKAKKMFAESGIPAALRPLCLTVFNLQKEAIFVEKTYQEQTFISKARQYFVYQLKNQ